MKRLPYGLSMGCLFPNMPSMKKVSQRLIGVGTLVSSQERRALFVPLINSWSNAGQPLILFLRRLFPDMPCMKRVYRDNRRRYTGQQPKRRAPAVPVINRG